MAINLTNLFTALGRVGKELRLIDATQDTLSTPFTSLTGYAYVNPSWLASLAGSYDAASRLSSQTMAPWLVTATNILQGFVLADNPAYGGTVSAALEYVREQFVDQSASVAECTVSATVTADPANEGTPGVTCSVYRQDGLTQQNCIPEKTTLVVTADSFTGGATRGREPWQWVGAPNVSSRGTGAAVGFYDFDWPQGSGAVVTGNFISADQDATLGGNLLTNGDFDTWTGSAPAVLDNWYLAGGTWGTDVVREATTVLGGTYAIKAVAGTAATWRLTQQFDSDVSDGTDPTAGTLVALPNYGMFTVCLWTKAAGVVSAGVLTVSLVDDTGTVINNQIGVANSQTLNLSALSTSWTPRLFTFQTPAVMADVVRLKVHMSTALAGANVYFDWFAATNPTNFYTGGPYAAGFSNPAAPVVATQDPDAWTLLLANDYAGSTYRSTWQALIVRLFQTPQLLLPYDASPTIADTLITS